MKASERFVRVMINCTADCKEMKATPETRRLMKKYGVTGWPTVVFLDPKGEIIDRFVSCKQPGPAEEQMKRIARRFTASKAPKAKAPKAPKATPDDGPWRWISKRLKQLQSKDAETRRRAAADLARLKQALDAAVALAGRQVLPAHATLLVQAHATVRGQGCAVELGCSGDRFFFFRLPASGPRPGRLVLLNRDGKTREARVPQADQWHKEELPAGFGPVASIRIYASR